MTDTEPLQAFLYRALASNDTVDQLVAAGSVRDGSGAPKADGRGSVLEDFDVTARTQAERMGTVYELLYCLENSVRELIERTLREAYGADSWWTTGVSESIRKSAERRKADDLKARWHGPRGESPLSYVDFPQYAEIITEQWDLFGDLIGDKEWLANYFSEMNRSRRALAHTGSLSESDVQRMELRIRDWLRVVG